MPRMNWMSMVAGAGIGAAVAMTVTKRREHQFSDNQEDNKINIRSIASNFLEKS